MTGDKSGKRQQIRDSIKDLVMAMLIVAGVFAVMVGSTGSWPPLVVVESWSMQHSDNESFIGVIDTGDLVMVKAVAGTEDIVTYVEGKATGYRSYSDFGDVIIYRRDGNAMVTPIIHRAVIYLMPNGTDSYSAPGLAALVENVDYRFMNSGDSWGHMTGDLVLISYGYQSADVTIPIGVLLNQVGELQEGFVTKGDNNDKVDLLTPGLVSSPIPIDWVVGKAQGELPWFGILKLYFTNDLPRNTPANSISSFAVCIVLIFVVPIAIEVVLWRRDVKKEKGKGPV